MARTALYYAKTLHAHPSQEPPHNHIGLDRQRLLIRAPRAGGALQRTNGDQWFTAYARAKLASLLSSNELARRLDGTGVTSNAVHPGMIATGFGGDGDLGGINAFLFRVLNRGLPGPEVGTRTPLYLAKAPELEGVTGRYIEKGAEKAPSALARDEALAKDLWARLERAIAA